MLKKYPSCWRYKSMADPSAKARNLTALTTFELSLDLLNEDKRDRKIEIHRLALAAFLGTEKLLN